MTTQIPLELLLVDDDLADVELMKEALHECRTRPRVSTFESGELLLEHLSRPEGGAASILVLLDLNMPGIGGRETLIRLKANPALRRIPVIVLTSSNSPDDIRRSYEIGANCYIVKPLELSQLVTVARRIEDFWFETAALPTGD